MTLPTLYKYTTNGQVQQWTIHVVGNSYYTVEGINTLSESKPTVCQGKNIGRSNETTPQAQAILEAQSKWQKKKDKGYNEVLTKEKKFFEPMLAFERSKYEKLLFTVPIYVQPKLDGCLDGSTLVKTERGELTIKEIVEQKLDVKVLSFNEGNSSFEYKSISNYMKNGIDIDHSDVEWFEIETEDGQKIKLTGNHKVYLPDLKCWRRVDELDISQNLLSV